MRHVPFLCLVTALAGCRAAPTVAPDGQLAHTVFFWLKPEAPAGTAQAMLSFYRTEVPTVPGVVAVLAGPPRPSERDVVDDSFAFGVTTVFADTEAEIAWQPHPVHERLIARFGPWLARVLVYDTLAVTTMP